MKNRNGNVKNKTKHLVIRKAAINVKPAINGQLQTYARSSPLKIWNYYYLPCFSWLCQVLLDPPLTVVLDVNIVNHLPLVVLGLLFLNHLSRRLTRWAYSIPMVRRPSSSSSVVVRRRPHFQTWISLKPISQSWSNFMCSMIGVGEKLHKVLRQIRS